MSLTFYVLHGANFFLYYPVKVYSESVEGSKDNGYGR